MWERPSQPQPVGFAPPEYNQAYSNPDTPDPAHPPEYNQAYSNQETPDPAHPPEYNQAYFNPDIFNTAHPPEYNQAYANPAPQTASWRQPSAVAPETLGTETELSLSIGDDMTAFTEGSIRQGFIRKVFAVLAVQLLVTFGVVTLFVTVDPVKRFVQDNLWVTITAAVTTLVIVVMLVCVEKMRRKFPQNIIFLMIFTVAEAWLLGAVSSQFDVDEVMMALGICAAVTTVMFLFGLQSKFDFTYLNGTLIVLSLCLLGFGLLCLIIQNSYLQLLYASLGALLFSLWIVVDVQLVVGKGQYACDTEEYILAALNIYLDIVNLFLFILQLIQACSD